MTSQQLMFIWHELNLLWLWAAICRSDLLVLRMCCAINSWFMIFMGVFFTVPQMLQKKWSVLSFAGSRTGQGSQSWCWCSTTTGRFFTGLSCICGATWKWGFSILTLFWCVLYLFVHPFFCVASTLKTPDMVGNLLIVCVVASFVVVVVVF